MATANVYGYGGQFTGGLTNIGGYVQPSPNYGQATYSIWGTSTTTPWYGENQSPPPWINDDMLEENAAKKLYEYISGEDQATTPVPITGKVAPDFKPRHSVVLKVLNELKGVRIFRGGTDQEWEHVKKLAEDWRKLAIKKGVLGANIQIRRVERKYVEQYYQLITKAWTFRKHSDKYSQMGDIAVDAYQVVKDAIREMSEKHPDLAVLEYEIIKAGGMIIGVGAHDMATALGLIVFYDSIGRSTMDKLVGDGKTSRRKSPQTKQTLAPFFVGGAGGADGSTQPNGMGGGGVGGAIYTLAYPSMTWSDVKSSASWNIITTGSTSFT